MIVGADAATDAAIVTRAAALYDRFRLRRVYYSAFSPIPDAVAVLPLVRPPLMREHRLYQADWMMRFYGFSSARGGGAAEAAGQSAARHRSQARLGAEASRLLPARRQPRAARGPAAGSRASASRRSTASSRRARHRRLRLDDVGRLTVSIAKLRPFLIAADWRPVALADAVLPLPRDPARQLELFG